jgi:hypothetical protein
MYQKFTAVEIALEKTGKDVTIHQDKWGVPRRKIKTDADTVFWIVMLNAKTFVFRLNYVEKWDDCPKLKVILSYTTICKSVVNRRKAAKQIT